MWESSFGVNMGDTKIKDMTAGSPMKLIFNFTIPIFFGMLFQQFYSIVDTMIVGKILGVDALAAVGATGSLTFMIIGLCNGIASGFAIPVAQRFGARDESGLKSYIANGVYLGAVVSVIITVIVTTFCYTILKIMNTPLNIIDESHKYLFIIFMGLPVTFFYNYFSGVMRSLGDSKTPLYFLLAASVLNIILDVVSIIYLGMGVEGAAYATILSQLIATIASGIYMWKKYPVLHMTKEERKAKMQNMGYLLYMGLPMGLQYSITAIGAVILQTALNGLGSMYVAAVTSGVRIVCFFFTMFDALGATMTTFGGQNVGARKLDRVKKGLGCACLIGSVYAVFAFGILYVTGPKLALLFVDASETELIANIAKYLVLESMFYIPLAFVDCFRYLLQGMGYSMLAIIAGGLEMLARIIAAFAIVPVYGFVGVCLAGPIAWIMADLYLIPTFFFVCHSLQKKFRAESRGACLEE